MTLLRLGTMLVLSTLVNIGSLKPVAAGDLSADECATLSDALTALLAGIDNHDATMQRVATLSNILLTELQPDGDRELIGVATELRDTVMTQPDIDRAAVGSGVRLYQQMCGSN